MGGTYEVKSGASNATANFGVSNIRSRITDQPAFPVYCREGGFFTCLPSAFPFTHPPAIA